VLLEGISAQENLAKRNLSNRPAQKRDHVLNTSTSRFGFARQSSVINTKTSTRQRGQPVQSRILLVEDNPDHALVASRVLERAGFTATVAETGELGISHALSGEFDLVLLDYGLPDMDGLKVLEAILGCGVPVVFVTGRADAKLAVDALRAGAANYIVKDSHYVSRLPQVAKETLEKLRDTARLNGLRVTLEHSASTNTSEHTSENTADTNLRNALGRTIPNEAIVVRHRSGDYLILARDTLPERLEGLPEDLKVRFVPFSLDGTSSLADLLV
jgi:CheY-like chemotaxis protein